MTFKETGDQKKFGMALSHYVFCRDCVPRINFILHLSIVNKQCILSTTVLFNFNIGLLALHYLTVQSKVACESRQMPFPSEIKWQKKDGEARLLRGVCALTLLLSDSKGIELITNLCHLPQTFSCRQSEEIEGNGQNQVHLENGVKTVAVV